MLMLCGSDLFNPAFSLGIQWEKYVTENVYCYVRHYRDYRCFVAINRANPITISERSLLAPILVE